MNESFNIEDHKKMLNYKTISETKLLLALKDLDMERSELDFETEDLHLNTENLIKKIRNEKKKMNEKQRNTSLSNDMHQSKTLTYVLAGFLGLLSLCFSFFVFRYFFEQKCLNKKHLEGRE